MIIRDKERPRDLGLFCFASKLSCEVGIWNDLYLRLGLCFQVFDEFHGGE